MLASRTLLTAFWTITSASASAVGHYTRSTIEALTGNQIDQFTPFTHFASTAYCPPDATLSWTCGVECEANADFVPTASGGDGASVQFWYVGYSPSQKSVIVAHQGTDLSKIEVILTNLDFFLEGLDPILFPGVPSSVMVHSGFADEHAKTAEDILSVVRTTILKHNATKVSLIGHSLGGALALLDSIYLPLHINGVEFRTITYGLPRVGNEAFADYVDSHTTLTHINNKKDLVPTLPDRLMGYRHASGEIHITEDNQWLSCPGQENPSPQCTAGDVPVFLLGNVEDHYGPYNGIRMGAGC